MTPVADLNAYS